MAIGAGCLVVVVVAIGWRRWQLRRTRRYVLSLMRDPAPATRAAGATGFVELGLWRGARTMLKRIEVEDDLDVLDAIAHSVATRAWEPVTRADTAALRAWARVWSKQRPRMVLPLPVSASPSVKDPVTDSAVDAPVPLAGAAPSAPTAMPAMPHLPASPVMMTMPEPPAMPVLPERTELPELPTMPTMAARVTLGPGRHSRGSESEHLLASVDAECDENGEPYRVLVSGVGGPAGVAVLQSLVRSGYEVVAADCDPWAVGLGLHDGQHVVLPRADAPDFVASLMTACRRFGVRVVVSTVAEELEVLAPRAGELVACGLAIWAPSATTIEACNDKWLFAQRCVEAHAPSPATALGGVEDLKGPWLVKPRRGRGSRDVFVCDSTDQVEAACRAMEEPIVQDRLAGREFTADFLISPDRTVVSITARWRDETKAGVSTKGETFVSPDLEFAVRQVAWAVDYVGVGCAQGFVAVDGSVSVFEINPRFSGGLPLSIAAGADLPGQYVRAALGLPVQPEKLRTTAGVRMARHHAEVFWAPDGGVIR